MTAWELDVLLDDLARSTVLVTELLARVAARVVKSAAFLVAVKESMLSVTRMALFL